MKSLYLWIWNFLGVGGTKWKNLGNSRGWGVKLETTLCGGGMDIFWNHTMYFLFLGRNRDILIYLAIPLAWKV